VLLADNMCPRGLWRACINLHGWKIVCTMHMQFYSLSDHGRWMTALYSLTYPSARTENNISVFYVWAAFVFHGFIMRTVLSCCSSWQSARKECSAVWEWNSWTVFEVTGNISESANSTGAWSTTQDLWSASVCLLLSLEENWIHDL